MRLKRIKLNNMRSYEDSEVILPKGSLLLSGDIGSGKTSILLAIEFALFGLQPGQRGASLLRNNANEGFVELELEIDGEEIIIKRTLKRKKSISQDYSFITINGKTTEYATTEIKNFILQKLNYPLEFSKKMNLLYRFTVYTQQEQMKQIILEDPETRLNTLRHVFGIDKYKRIKENNLILTLKLREICRMKQGQIFDMETMRIRFQERKNSLAEKISQVPFIEKQLLENLNLVKNKENEVNEVKQKIEEKKKLEYEIEKTEILLIAKKDQLLKSQKEIGSSKNKLEKAIKDFKQEEFEATIKLISEKKSIQDQINKEIMSFSAKIASLISKKHDLEKLKEKISGLKTCPTCLQEVREPHKHAILNEAEKEVSLINNERISIDNEKQKKEIFIKQILSEIEELEKKKSNLQDMKIRLITIEEDNKMRLELEKQKSSLENDIKILNDQILRLKNSISELKKFDNIIILKDKELFDIKEIGKRLEIKKAEIIKEIEIFKAEIERFEKEINEKEKIREELVYNTELENWLSGEFLELISFIEKNIMIKLKVDFSKLFNEWFSILVPDTFTVSLDDSFTPIIEQQDYELDYSYLSGGERTAIALAYRLALNQTINSILSEVKTKGIVILDEPTEGFSQQQLDKMRDVLRGLNSEQLIIVSHDQKMESFVDNIIRIKKEHNVARVLN